MKNTDIYRKKLGHNYCLWKFVTVHQSIFFEGINVTGIGLFTPKTQVGIENSLHPNKIREFARQRAYKKFQLLRKRE